MTTQLHCFQPHRVLNATTHRAESAEVFPTYHDAMRYCLETGRAEEIEYHNVAFYLLKGVELERVQA